MFRLRKAFSVAVLPQSFCVCGRAMISRAKHGLPLHGSFSRETWQNPATQMDGDRLIRNPTSITSLAFQATM